MPDVDLGVLARGFTMALQLILITVSRHRRLDSLTGHEYKADNLDAAYAVLLDFATAGLSNLR